jgi:ribosome-binding protein aMBF1 (putative translation factor)
MIRTDADYLQARTRLLDEKKRLSEHEARMKEKGLGPAELKRAIDPLRSFTLQLDEEVEAYERMQRGSFEPTENLAAFGRLLIAARIFRKISQRELAKMLGVHESQVSRDERNEYRSITVERANRILEVLRVQLTSEMRPLPEERAPAAQTRTG